MLDSNPQLRSQIFIPKTIFTVASMAACGFEACQRAEREMEQGDNNRFLYHCIPLVALPLACTLQNRQNDNYACYVAICHGN